MFERNVILLADGFTDPDRFAAALRGVSAGVRWVHLRDHGASDEAFLAGAERFVDTVRQRHPGIRVSVNSRSGRCGGARRGISRRVSGCDAGEARQRLGEEAIIGYSAHELCDVTGPLSEVVDYFFYSPIFPTRSKPGHPGVGIDALAEVCTTSTRPLYALGGVTPRRTVACMEAGAAGIAVLSGIMEASDPAEAAEAYLSEV